MKPSTLVYGKALADIAVGLILFAKPKALYESIATKALASITGLYLTDASIAPGFNHSIACLVTSVGIGGLVAARAGPVALPTIFAMTTTWSLLSLLTCALAPTSWGVSGATLLMGGLVNATFSIALYSATNHVRVPRLLRDPQLKIKPPAGAQIWSVYILEAEKYDKALVDGWRNNMNGLLIFAGLFSSILTTLIVESYPLLQNQPSQETLLTLYIAEHPNGPFNASILSNLPTLLGLPSTPAPTAAIVCNVLWFIALGLSLASALIATLVDQFAREFLQHTEMLPSPVKRARIFSYLFYGLQRFRMHAIVGVIPLLLHLSLLFFFGGLVAFLQPYSHLVAGVVAALLLIIVAAYLAMTLLPLFLFDCPYKTPLSNLLWGARVYLFRILDKDPDSPQAHSMVDAMIEKATVRSDSREERDKRALAWTMKSLADDDELEPFVEGIPNAIWGPTTQSGAPGRRKKYDNLMLGLLKDEHVQLGTRIEHLLDSCNSGLLEPLVQSRREVVCLKAIWGLGMTAEMGERGDKDERPMTTKRRRFWPRRADSIELVDVERPEETIPMGNPWDRPRLPTVEQPLSYFKDLSSLSASSRTATQYIPSITALVQWNDLCALNGHVEKLKELLDQPTALIDVSSVYFVCRRALDALLDAHRKFVWRHVIPTGFEGEQNLEMLAKAPHPVNVPDWMAQVRRIVQQMPLAWNKVQYRILHSYLRASAEAEEMPYEFELTCQTIRPSEMNTFDNDMVGNVLTTFSDNVQKATKLRRPEVTHVDTVLGILLPWFDRNKDLDLHVVQRVVDAVIGYINTRGQDEAIARVLRDCDITLLWTHITDRLVTARAEWLPDVSRAMWKLAMLFPGPSAQETRLESAPRFGPSTLSVIPVAPYAVSVITLLKRHILNAYEQKYAQEQLIKQTLLELQKQLALHEQPSAAFELKRAINDARDGWELMTAVHGVMMPLPLKGLPLEEMPTLPVYTIQTVDGYKQWWRKTTEAVDHVVKLGARLERRVDQARFAIAIEFLEYCATVDDAQDLPYRAVNTFSENVIRGLYVQDAPHVDSQRSFVEALRGLAVTGSKSRTSEHSQLAWILLESSLFAGRDESKLPWLDDLTAARTLQDIFRTHLPFFTTGGGLGLLRKIEDVLGWLDLKITSLESGNFEEWPGMVTAGPSSLNKSTINRTANAPLPRTPDPGPPTAYQAPKLWPVAGPSKLSRY
uniref:DUF6535 domain-containing protein n=1 Tax=Mycena chlorophos TaxID=658473 RepID=A0ABQ0LNR0_MYCCL|nr:predicted protein [Mycena chlorophos]